MNWIIGETAFDPGKITAQGNKFLTGNGYMGVRGTLEEYQKEQLTAVNLAGIYDRVGDGWREPLNAPNALFTRLKVDGAVYGLPQTAPLSHSISLDFRRALFARETVWTTAHGIVSIRTERFVSLANVHLLALKYTVTADFCAEIELLTGIDADVWDINGPHYDEMSFAEERGSITAIGTTHESRDRVCAAESCHADFVCTKQVEIEEKQILHHFCFTAEPGKDYEITKCAAVYTSRDTDGFLYQAKQLVMNEIRRGYNAARDLHIKEWERKWCISEVVIEGDDDAMEALNYSLYHLHCIAPRHSDSLSVAARGLSGQTYKGAVFWDTEMFMQDFFLFTEPAIAKTLVRYRIDTLAGARDKAKSYGYDGAFYAWESQEGGFDACTDYNVTDVFTGRPMRTYFRDKQIHISAAIVHGIMRYAEFTGDQSILEEGGAEVILECAKFYYFLLIRQIHSEVYELHDTIGPDEYHERVNNNGYTNRMAKYTFACAVKVIDQLKNFAPDVRRHLGQLYAVQEARQRYEEAASRIYLPQPDKNGVIGQFDGYMDLEDASIDTVKGRLLHEKEYWGGAYGVAAHTQIIKQADVAAWLTLFPEDFTKEILLKNWNYYEPRTEHGSSLSNCMYALLACKCGIPDKAYPFFLKSARADIDEGGKEWAGLIYIGGTHPAAAGGAYMTAVNGFGGLYIQDGELKAKPQMPSAWKSLLFRIWYKGVLYEIKAEGRNSVIRKC